MIRRVLEHPRLTGRYRQVFVGLLAVGLLGRLAVAFSTRGQVFDIDSYELVRDALFSEPLQVYSTVNGVELAHWPYPPGFFGWVVLSEYAARATGLRFDGFIQVAPILADAGLAWIVQAFLGARGASERTRVLAAALVLLGPSFAIISGFHGQLDALSILPAALGFWCWTRLDPGQRALITGVLIGAGGSIKIPSLLLVLALLPSARSFREGATLLVAAGAVPLLLFAPWLAADAEGTIAALRMNDGIPGFGGISLLVQPDLSAAWLHTKDVELSGATRALMDVAAIIAIGSLLVTGAFMLWRRVPPLSAAVLLWVSVYAFGVNYGLTYLIWGIPFFLMAGQLRHVAVLQAVVVVPMVMLYGVGSRELPLEVVYTPLLLAVWAAFVVIYVIRVRAIVRGPEHPVTAQPG